MQRRILTAFPILALALFMAGAWSIHEWTIYKTERAVADEVEAAGGWTIWESRRVARVAFSCMSLEGEIPDECVDVSVLSRLRELDRLRALTINECAVRDADLSVLRHLDALEELVLLRTPITGTCLRFLQDNESLSVLSLRHSHIDDNGLRTLPRLPTLEILVLSDTYISDEGLMALRRQRSLRVLYVSGTCVTRERVERLSRSLPHVEIDVLTHVEQSLEPRL